MKSEREHMDMIAAYNDVGSYRGSRSHLRRRPQDSEEGGARPAFSDEPEKSRPSAQL